MHQPSETQLHNNFSWHLRSQSYLLFKNLKVIARLMRSTASLSGAIGKKVLLRSSFSGRGSIRVFNILIQNHENTVFSFLQSVSSMKTEPGKIFSNVFKIRTKTQILVNIQIEAIIVTWKSGLLTQ